MNFLRRTLTGFALSLALTTCFGGQLFASSHSSSSSESDCSIGCSDGSDCKKVCVSRASVREGCIFVPERTEMQLDGECGLEPVLIPGANLYFREQGREHESGPTIVFVPPTGLTSDVWRCQQEELSKCYRTIAVDLRGTGRSDVTDPEAIAYTHQVFANDIYAMLNDPVLHVGSNVIMVGCELGGSIGIVYAASFPDEISKLVLVNSGPGLYFVNDCALDPACDQTIPCGDDGSCCAINCGTVCWPFPMITQNDTYESSNILQCCTFICSGENEEEFEACYEQCVVDYNAWVFPRRYLNEPCQPKLANLQALCVQSFSAATISGVIENIIYNAWSQDLRPLLDQIDVPTLICIGTIDEALPNGAGIYLNNNINHSKLAKFEDKGHLLQATAYKQFNKVLKTFVKNRHFPAFIDIPNKGCCVCPLIKPVPLFRCSEG
ncbi:MAG: alpha/beta hydrolase [Chlamydiales bacterium]|nr:alpha/beta hydrolase [Chlamydiales bacterium]